MCRSPDSRMSSSDGGGRTMSVDRMSLSRTNRSASPSSSEDGEKCEEKQRVYDVLVQKAMAFIKFFGMDPRRTRFRAHRFGGALFLIAYLISWTIYIYDYERFQKNRIAILPALIGVFQAVSAAMTFRFLPNDENSGYFSDKGILSRAFVKENIFYQLQTAFGAIWYTLGNETIEHFLLGKIMIIIFVFLPFTVLRPFFPTTRFSTTHRTKGARYRTSENEKFYFTGTELIRYFYLYGKHVMGFGFNYLFWLDRVTPQDMKNWGVPLLLLNTGTVSIAVFLHTLRFKKLMKPTHAFLIYLGMAYASFLAVPPLTIKLAQNPLLAYLILQSIILNLNVRYGYRKLMHAHYFFAMAILLRQRSIEGNPFLSILP